VDEHRHLLVFIVHGERDVFIHKLAFAAHAAHGGLLSLPASAEEGRDDVANVRIIAAEHDAQTTP